MVISMISKKATAKLLLVVLILSTVSCGAETAQDTLPLSDISDNVTTPSDTSEYTAPDVSFNGETVRIATCQWDTPWQLANYNHVAEYEENGDVLNDALVKRTRQIEEELEVKLEAFPMKERQKPTEFINAVAAGDDEFAFGMVMSCGLPQILGTDGMLIDLNTVSTLDLTHSWWNQNAVKEMNLFGFQYAALGDINIYTKGGPIVTYFNKQMITDYKLDDPYKLVESGKWTIDKMTEMAVSVAHDVDGNGVIEDTTDCFGMMCEKDSQVYLLTGCGVRFSEHDDKDIKITVMSERTTNAIEKIVSLMNLKDVTLVDVDHLSGRKNVFFELYIPTLGANRGLFFQNQLVASLNMRSLEVDFGVLPMPKYDEAQENYSSFANTWFTDYVVIPATNTDLERTGALIEAMSYYSQQYVTPAFIDNVVMNKTVRDEESAAIIQDIIDNMQYDIALIFNWGGIQDTVTKMRTLPGQSYASVYDAQKNQILEAMNKTVAELRK